MGGIAEPVDRTCSWPDNIATALSSDTRTVGTNIDPSSPWPARVPTAGRIRRSRSPMMPASSSNVARAARRSRGAGAGSAVCRASSGKRKRASRKSIATDTAIVASRRRVSRRPLVAGSLAMKVEPTAGTGFLPTHPLERMAFKSVSESTQR